MVTLKDDFKKNKLLNTFRFKDCIPNLHLPLISLIVGSALNPIMVNVLDTFNLRIGEHIRIPSLPKKKVKPKNSNHLRLWSHSPSSNSFNVLTRENWKCLHKTWHEIPVSWISFKEGSWNFIILGSSLKKIDMGRNTWEHFYGSQFSLQVSQNDRKTLKLQVLLFLAFYSKFYRGEWPSGLRRCDQSRKVSSSNPNWRSAGPRDPTSLWSSR